jgi:hypothetical protein
MSVSPHPIAKLAFALLETDRSGSVTLSGENEQRLAEALLSHGDGELFDAVRELTVVGGLMTKLSTPNAAAVGDRILCIAELAIDRLKRINGDHATEVERLRASVALKMSSPELPKRAPVLGTERPKGSVSLTSLHQRVIR